ncbi:DNA-binding PadR family transcriptional regulator [Catenulispora sp. GAS73]|uniref:PadR family transcriptional regulator n=1 Tax=Catenulispora sp. GAS73 TaxID=3156269 RepID=UPI003512F75E
MLPLAILGFLAEGPLHGYQLKERITALTGHVKPVSDGALYPAISRLESQGRLERWPEPGAGAATRQVLGLTDAGRAELARRLREPTEVEITDRNRYFTILAFLHRLEDPAAQAAVLRRRLAFLDAPGAGFFFGADGKPVKAEDAPTLFQRGMGQIARATARAEREWLHTAIAELDGASGE